MNNKLKFLSAAAVLVGTLGSSSSAFADDGILTGDTKLACEAILCLSSGTRPGECGPSLARYFGISFKFWSDTVKARRNFLHLCPSSNDTSTANMPQIVDNIANGAGRCDANYLNATQRRVVQRKICPPQNAWQLGGNNWWGGRNSNWAPPDNTWTPLDDGTGCYVKDVVVISNTKPAICSAYTSSQYTYLLGVHYVGDPTDGTGRWVDDSAGAGVAGQ
ncbi:TrbM/KikA/MpfK family conjugal transfer protein [Burkholderia cenocepacia]|uniref:TrbM/KikA/MpfK family conjugal transfer protein n=1 Tax=Burkholderia cenocepacia TaxID=95486 RepID=UPI002ABE8FEA|nr:TrbM/KikA/MpfK family conjugal transfer protein [Burkholderia cenocepacia]